MASRENKRDLDPEERDPLEEREESGPEEESNQEPRSSLSRRALTRLATLAFITGVLGKGSPDGRQGVTNPIPGVPVDTNCSQGPPYHGSGTADSDCGLQVAGQYYENKHGDADCNANYPYSYEGADNDCNTTNAWSGGVNLDNDCGAVILVGVLAPDQSCGEQVGYTRDSSDADCLSAFPYPPEDNDCGQSNSDSDCIYSFSDADCGVELVPNPAIRQDHDCHVTGSDLDCWFTFSDGDDPNAGS